MVRADAAPSALSSRARRRSPLILFLITLAAGPLWAAPPAWLPGVGSLLVPGLGQAANGDYAAGALHLGVFAAAAYGAAHYSAQDDFLEADERYDEDDYREYVNATTLRYDYAARLATDTALYSSFAAYRDARRRNEGGYWTPVPQESLTDIAVAPFAPEYLLRPTTWVPLAIEAVLLATADDAESWGIYRADDVSREELHAFNLISNEMTAVGEEAFFRGFLNNEFSNNLGAGWGLALSSVVFGLAHTGQGQTATPLAATFAGAYLGWLQQRNGYDLRQGAALHFWFNVLAGIAAIENGGGTEVVRIGLEF